MSGELETTLVLRVVFITELYTNIKFGVTNYDVVFAVPIFFAPREVLGFFGWVAVDPLAARLAAAALFGIGLESFMGRNSTVEAFKGMLQLKIVWSGFATLGLAWSVAEDGLRYPWIGWVLVGVFAAFHVLWWYWRLRLDRN